MIEIIRKYESNFGAWYVQVIVNDVRLELSFKEDPTEQQIIGICNEIIASSNVEVNNGDNN